MISIAVTGIDCRFPGAPDKESFWRLLMDGAVADAEVPAQRWDVETYYHSDGIAGSMNTRRGHFIDDADAFDTEFFGVAPVEAAALDPQQRLLLQTSWRAIEDSGIDPRSLAGTATGVFVGVMSSEWSTLQLLDFAKVNAFCGTGSGYFMVANRISYHLGLAGPSMAIDSACSSSLTAIHQACAALRSGEADTAIAAGVNLILTPALSIFYTQAGLSAPDGRCKPFRRDANGIGRGEGVAAVVLRRLDDALADGQPIYAVVRSSATNHDGRSNGITAPSRRSQAALMRRAMQLAEVEARQIHFVEAHGTGTVLGDMIEASALGDVHSVRREQPCLLGSVKGNIGHAEGSAGIAAFIKACLALQHGVLPPAVVGDSDDGENPELQLGSKGLQLARGPQVLPAHGALGGVSSFGLGGGNAHVIVESAPVLTPAPPLLHSSQHGVVTVSAPSDQALRRNAASQAVALRRMDPTRVAAWCATTNAVKRSLRHRFAAAGNRDSLADLLEQFAAGTRPDLASARPRRQVPASVGLLFSGQGAQFAGMTRPLYQTNPVYRQHLDAVASVLSSHLDTDLLDVVFGDEPGLDRTELAQPALFAVSYALGTTLLESGIRPSYGVGHSVGEIAAACLAGVLTVDGAARLVTTRAQLMGSLPAGGAMLAVDLGIEQLQIVLTGVPGCVIAAINGPRALTVSGPADAIARVGRAVRRQGGKAVNLTVSHAFHSPLMEPIVAQFRHDLAGLDPQQARFPLFSTVSGKQVDGRELTADYWAQQICAPVRFWDAVHAASITWPADYVAGAGPNPALLRLARRCEPLLATPAFALCAGPDSDGTELLSAAATLLRDGYSPALEPLYGGTCRPAQRVSPYVFDTNNRFWRASELPHSEHRLPIVDVQTPGEVTPVDNAPAHDRAADEVLALIADVGNYPVAALTPSKRLADDLGYDSLLQLRLLDRLCSEYPQLQEVDVTELLPRIGNVGDLVDFVVHQLNRTA